jgi:hypothetical protein
MGPKHIPAPIPKNMRYRLDIMPPNFLTKERQSSLDDQAAKNHEELPVLLERLFKERRL